MQLANFLRRASGVGAIGVADRVAGLALGILLARWLGADGYGVYAFVMAIVVLLLIPTEFGLPDWLMRQIARDNGATSPALCRNVLMLVAGLGSGIALVASIVVTIWVAEPARATAIIVGLWILPLRGVMNSVGYILRGHGRAQLAQITYVLVPTLIALASCLFAVFVLAAPEDPGLALGLRIIAITLALGVGIAVVWRVHPLSGDPVKTSPHTILWMFREAFPFLLIGAMTRLLSRTDVLMLGLLLGTREAGIYHIALQAALVVQFAMTVSNTITTPEFARLHAAGDHMNLQTHAQMSARVVVAVGLPLAGLLIWFGGDIIAFLFGEAFRSASTPLGVLTAGYTISFLFGAPGFLLNMTGFERMTFRVYGVIAVANIGLNICLIPIYGLVGAAIATSLALITQNLALWLAVRRELGMSCAVI